jgi:hypothetical protein
MARELKSSSALFVVGLKGAPLLVHEIIYLDVHLEFL